MDHNSHPFHTLTYVTLFLAASGALLYVGQSFLVPIVVALILAYILTSTSEYLGQFPGLRRLPEFARRILVLILLSLLLVLLGSIVSNTTSQIIKRLPEYQHNLNLVANELIARWDLNISFDSSIIWQQITARIQLQDFILDTLSTLSSVIGWLFLVIFYAAFMIVEKGSFDTKINAAFPGKRGEKAAAIVYEINHSIGAYLAIKTLINIVLGVCCLIVLILFGVDFAIFNAILIGLFNYIPYIGSFIGVAFPVLLTIAQYGSFGSAAVLFVILTAIQSLIGNVIEPKLIGQKVNMSPMVVMLSLTLWTALWGITGAILAVPMTAMIAIVLLHFDSSKPFAILLAEDVQSIVDKYGKLPHP